MFKKNFLVFVCLSLILPFASCSDSPIDPNNDSIVGRWILNEVALSGRILSVEEWGSTMSYSFKLDNSYEHLKNQQLVETGSFSITSIDTERRLYLCPSGDHFYYWIDQGYLYMYRENLLGSPTYRFIRQ
jgi:hypothetical protein